MGLWGSIGCLGWEFKSTSKSGTVQFDFLQLVTGLMSKLSREEWDFFWVTFWQICNQWNTAMHGGVFQHPSRSAQ